MKNGKNEKICQKEKETEPLSIDQMKTRQNIDGVIVIADDGKLMYILPKTFDSLLFKLYKDNHHLLLEKIKEQSKKEKL